MIGKIIFIIYIISIVTIGICGIYYEPEENKFNFNWIFVLFMILYLISPIIAKFCGLI